MAPVDAAGNDFVVGLEEDAAVSEVLEERIDGRLDVEGIKPKGKYSGFSLALGVEVLDFKLFLFGDRVESRMSIEKVGNESEVEFWITSDEGARRKEFAAVKSVSILEDFFCALMEIVGLKR